MRKTLYTLLLFIGALFSAQDSFDTELVKNVNNLYEADNYQTLSKIESTFIHQMKNDDSWYPYYYGALTSVRKAGFKVAEDNAKVDGELTTAIKFLLPIYSKNKNNEEINSLLGIVYFLKSKYNAYKKDSYLKKAKKYYSISQKLAPNNPRTKVLATMLSGNNIDKHGEIEHNQKTAKPIWNANLLQALLSK